MNNPAEDGVVKKWLVAPALLVALAAGLTAGAATGKSSRTAAQFDPTCGPARTAARPARGPLGAVALPGAPTPVGALEFWFVADLVQVGVTPVGIADDNDPTRIIPPV